MFGTKHSKITDLKYGNIKLLENTKYNQVKLVFAVFASAFFTKLALNYNKQARYN